MILKTFSCKCGTNIVLDIPMTAPREEQQTQTEWCPKCQRVQTLERVWAPVNFTFGMMSKQYGGQLAAVNGWGTHKLDYDKKSDLATGRAQEVASYIKPAELDKQGHRIG